MNCTSQRPPNSDTGEKMPPFGPPAAQFKYFMDLAAEIRAMVYDHVFFKKPSGVAPAQSTW